MMDEHGLAGPARPQPVHSGITSDPIDMDALRAHVADSRHGAVVLFEGIVRNHDGGRQVRALEYQVHPDAQHFLDETLRAIAMEHPEVRLAAVHRFGPLDIGDVAFAAAVGAAHRGIAFTVCAIVVDRVKAELPIWKKQVFDDDSHEWVNFA